VEGESRKLLIHNANKITVMKNGGNFPFVSPFSPSPSSHVTCHSVMQSTIGISRKTNYENVNEMMRVHL
jgi:hypothetical protein